MKDRRKACPLLSTDSSLTSKPPFSPSSSRWQEVRMVPSPQEAIHVGGAGSARRGFHMWPRAAAVLLIAVVAPLLHILLDFSSGFLFQLWSTQYGNTV